MVDPDGDTLSQDWLSLTLQDRVPPPALLTVMSWVAGFAPPCMAVKERLVLFRLMIGAAVRSKVTVAICGEFVAAGSVTVSDSGASNSPQTVSVNLTVNAPPTQSATLTWNANSEPDLDWYKIYRKTSSGASYGSPIATVSAGTTTYQDSGLVVGNTYFYAITAGDTSNNESGVSNEVSKSIF